MFKMFRVQFKIFELEPCSPKLLSRVSTLTGVYTCPRERRSPPTAPPAALRLARAVHATRMVSRVTACAPGQSRLCAAPCSTCAGRAHVARPCRAAADQRSVGRPAPVKRCSSVPVRPAPRQQSHEPTCLSPAPPNSPAPRQEPAHAVVLPAPCAHRGQP